MVPAILRRAHPVDACKGAGEGAVFAEAAVEGDGGNRAVAVDQCPCTPFEPGLQYAGAGRGGGVLPEQCVQPRRAHADEPGQRGHGHGRIGTNAFDGGREPVRAGGCRCTRFQAIEQQRVPQMAAGRRRFAAAVTSLQQRELVAQRGRYGEGGLLAAAQGRHSITADIDHDETIVTTRMKGMIHAGGNQHRGVGIDRRCADRGVELEHAAQRQHELVVIVAVTPHRLVVAAQENGRLHVHESDIVAPDRYNTVIAPESGTTMVRILLVFVVLAVAGILLFALISRLQQRSREIEKTIDYSKMKEWKDED